MYSEFSKRRIIKQMIIFAVLLCIMWINSNIFSASYLYEINKSSENTQVYKEEESSISTSANSILTIRQAEFKFESVSQILIEPTTNTVLYENNADEKLLPASVTKVMTY